MSDDMITVKAEVVRQFYEKDNFRIFLMEDNEGELFSAKGEFGRIDRKERLIMYGKWGNPYGDRKTFECSYFDRVPPETTAGIEEYLASGCVEGCGPVLAEKIVEKFGKDTFRILDSEPDRLLEVYGIGEVKKERIKAGWKKQKALQNIGQFLFMIGLPIRYTSKIRREFGDKAIEIIKADPYSLTAVRGITFETADQAAMRMGIKKDSPFRIRSGITYVMSEICEMSDTYAEKEDLIYRTSKMLCISRKAVAEEVTSLAKDGVLVEEDNAVYTRGLYDAETKTAETIKEMICTSPKPCRALQEDELENETGIKYSEKQLEAVYLAAKESVLVITGGPGTGKSTILSGILLQFRLSGLVVRMAAPTGRAAKKMSEVTKYPASTIHRMLIGSSEAAAEERNTGTAIDADVVIIDEMSMVDIELMARLLSSINFGTRLILIGDADQLPSVGPGTVLRDIIRSGVVKTVRLDRIFRQKEGSGIVENAERIRRGITELRLNKRHGGVYFVASKGKQQDIAEKVADIAYRQVPEVFGFKEEDIQVLSPMRKNDAGVNNLNIILQDKFNKAGEKIPTVERLRIGDRVMNTRNNYSKKIFNGDIGRIVGIDKIDKTAFIDFDDDVVSFDYDELDDIVLCYATTIHKSQGSEYPVVILPIIYDYGRMLQRTLLYTAVTRAKKMLVIVGDIKAVKKAVLTIEDGKRKGRLCSRLTEKTGGQRIENI